MQSFSSQPQPLPLIEGSRLRIQRRGTQDKTIRKQSLRQVEQCPTYPTTLLGRKDENLVERGRRRLQCEHADDPVIAYGHLESPAGGDLPVYPPTKRETGRHPIRRAVHLARAFVPDDRDAVEIAGAQVRVPRRKVRSSSPSFVPRTPRRHPPPRSLPPPSAISLALLANPCDDGGKQD